MFDYYEMIERSEEFAIPCLGKRYWISQTKEYILSHRKGTKEEVIA